MTIPQGEFTVCKPAQPAARRTYADLLHLDTLMSAARQMPEHPDGRFFIMVHQVYELWFEVVLEELTVARDAMMADRAADALYSLRRVASIDRLLLAQIETLTTISPAGFDSLRPHLGTASGLQSVRFREIEYLSGLRERDFTGYAGRTGAERSRLLRRLREPSVWDGFLALLERRGEPDPVRLYRSGRPDSDLVEIAESMLDHDETWAMWRMRHAVVVERMIGRKTGTGGSSGVDYLNSRRDERFFPQLWHLRSRITQQDGPSAVSAVPDRSPPSCPVTGAVPDRR
ncbi:MAG: tryptophan 2,3-dioxygenase family protein [Actinocatenispora sp.]